MSHHHDDAGPWPEYDYSEIVDHVVPGLGFVICALLLAFPWLELHEDAALRSKAPRFTRVVGGTVFLFGLGGTVAATVRGYLDHGSVVANAFHEAMLFGFIGLGLVALLGGVDGPWPAAAAATFFSLALIFYGHSFGDDAGAAAHFLVFVFCAAPGLLFVLLELWRYCYALRLMCAFAIFVLGVWFFAAAHILFSAQVNPGPGEVYLVAAFVLQVDVAAFWGLFILLRFCLPARFYYKSEKEHWL